MEIRWKAYTHIYHPFGDLLWHLFWGVIIGSSTIFSIINHDFWGLAISIMGLVFFFHPKFYEPHLMDIRLTEEGVKIDEKLHPWKKFYAFEIFDNGFRKFIFFYPTNISFGVHVPLEEFFVREEEVKEFLKKYLEEKEGGIPFLVRLYRAFYL